MSTARTRLADTLRAEMHGNDLQDDGHRIAVCAEREDGTLYELGHVTANAVYQDPNAARAMIGRIKFGSRHPDPDRTLPAGD